MIKEALRACLLAIGLVSMALGTAATAETAGSGAPAQAQDVSGAKKMSAGVMDQLKAKGATIVPHMTRPRELRAKAQGSTDNSVCVEKRCACKGGNTCADFFEANPKCSAAVCGTSKTDNEVYCTCNLP
jgi:hypothetical protein